ncbi:hypothetical protein DOY81_007600 [Sarcophaga bullata]|nr:hypothetical protein DOY81_007600 [Sarcophaga bullata]
MKLNKNCRFSDVYKSIIWLEKNMNLFQGRVYKPMIVELKVRNPNSAKYLENIIPIRDLLAFSCENPSDLSVLVTELCTKQKLMVNVFHASQPDQSIFIPRVKIDDIRKYGFESYLIDQVSGPPAILGYLCSVYNLQNIPFGDNKVNNFTDQIPKDIRCYFGGHLHYTLTFSKYGNRAQSLMQSYIKGKRFLSSKDENEINNIKTRLSEIIPKNDKLRNHRTAIEAEIRKYEILYKEQSQVLKELAGRASELEQKINQLERQKQKISLLQQDLVGIPEMEKKLKETGLKLLKDIIQLEHSKVGAFGIFQKAIANKTCSKTKLFIFKQENEELNNVIQTAKEKLDSAQVFIVIIYII